MSQDLKNLLVNIYDEEYATTVIAWIDVYPALKPDRILLIMTLIESGLKVGHLTKQGLNSVMTDCDPVSRPLDDTPSYVHKNWRVNYAEKLKMMWADHCKLEGVGMSEYCQTCIRQAAFCACARDQFFANVKWKQFLEWDSRTRGLYYNK